MGPVVQVGIHILTDLTLIEFFSLRVCKDVVEKNYCIGVVMISIYYMHDVLNKKSKVYSTMILFIFSVVENFCGSMSLSDRSFGQSAAVGRSVGWSVGRSVSQSVSQTVSHRHIHIYTQSICCSLVTKLRLL